MIYFDHAATSYPKPPSVAQAAAEAISHFGNPGRSAHGFSLAASRAVEQARARAAELFGCLSAERLAFTKNATEALNIAVASLGGHVVTTAAEHNSVLRPVFLKKEHTVVPVDEHGGYTVGDLERALRPDTVALVLGHASNLTGNLAPVEEIGRLCRRRDLLFILDAAQTAGLVGIDMEKMGIDALCFTGHKALYGLQGTGGLALSRRFTPRPLMVGGSGHHSFEADHPREMPDRLEAGTLNSHGLAALAAGLDYVMERGPENLLAEADRLARMFYEGAQAVDGAVFYGDYQAARRVPIVTLNLGARPSDEVATELWEEYDIAVRAGAHCAPGLHRRFGTEKQGAVRFSFSHFNTEDEVATALKALAELARRRGMDA